MIKLYSILLIIFLATSQANAAPEVSIKDISGKTHHLPDYKGKWLIVNYWATWCPPCLQEIPDFIALYDQRKNKDVMIIGVAFEFEDSKEISKFVDDQLISYPIALGNDEIVKAIGGAEVMPTTYIFDPAGKLVKIHRGLITKPYIEKLINQH